MNDFDKWYKNSGCAWSFPSGCTNEAKFKVGWKAALEWIRSRHIKRLISINEIDEELEEE